MPDSFVSIVGNVTRDPDLRYTPSGVAVITFGVAINHRFLRNGEWEERTSFVDVTAWRDLADHVAETMTKGARVAVLGRLESQTWETPDGDKRSKIVVVADEVSPSLRWATANVTKTTRGAGPTEPAGAYAYDEEPF